MDTIGLNRFLGLKATHQKLISILYPPFLPKWIHDSEAIKVVFRGISIDTVF